MSQGQACLVFQTANFAPDWSFVNSTVLTHQLAGMQIVQNLSIHIGMPIYIELVTPQDFQNTKFPFC